MGQHSEIAAALMILIGYYSIMMIACIVQAKTKKKTIARGYSHHRNDYSR
ncbi:MAG: hypothetical protein ACXVJB_00895 [Mucilaginibacter sp.]